MLFPWYEPFLLMRFATSITCIRLRESCSMLACLMLLVRGIVSPATMAQLRFDVAPLRWILASQPIHHLSDNRSHIVGSQVSDGILVHAAVLFGLHRIILVLLKA